MRQPKYRRHSVRNVGFVEWQGQRHYLPGAYDSSESTTAYRQFLREVVYTEPAAAPAEIRDGERLSVAGLVARYLKFARKRYPGARSEYGNCKAALLPLAERFGAVLAEDFGPKRLKEWQAELSTADSKRSYVNSRVSKIKRAFRWGVSEELIPAGVYQALTAVLGVSAGQTEAREASPRKPVEWEHVKLVIDNATPAVAAMVTLQWYTGARSSSICQATPSQFTPEGKLLLWRPRHKNEFRGQELVLPIGPKCRTKIKAFLRRAADTPMFNPREQRKNGRYNTRYTPYGYRQSILRILKRLNEQRAAANPKQKPIPLWTPHQLRHSLGHAMRDKYGIEAAQAMLGHASLEATQIYSARRLALAKDIAKEIG